MGTFFHKLGGLWHKFFGSAPEWFHHASMVLSFVGPLASGIIAQVDADDAPEARAVIGELQKNLTLAAGLLTHSNAPDTPGKVRDYVAAVKANLNDLLTAGHIKNPDKLAKIKGVADTITGELDAVLGVLPK